ncbi:hypothetical protein [Glycomyces paridis]|uniref:Uncharacterized protein n=1 Tax=Glycomyces paridis TaxID=2126555 RepID=A0A4S8P6X4_9ACTN|nr:hypothetical protein [Glycomyces paridis]THV23509.1 hypothetical protein E9998_23215 [Glycomyces paridis]
MRARQEARDDEAVPGVEADALRLSDMEGRERVDMTSYRGWTPDDDAPPPHASVCRARLVLIGVAVGLAAAGALAVKLAYDRRKAEQGHRLVVAHLEDARSALVSAAGEIPELGREVIDRVRRR